MKFKDQLHRSFTLNETPKRIVSLVPSQTELLCDLGLKDAIVGITKFCVHPADLKASRTIVGGTKQLHIKRIEALDPDIILCNKEENTKEIVEACESICPVHVSDIYTIEDSLELIEQYGAIFDRETKAGDIIETIIKTKKQFEEYINTKPVLKVAYLIWYKPWMVAANNTFINHLLELNGFENIFDHLTRYPEISIDNEEIEQADLLLLSSEPFPFKKSHIKELGAHSKKTIPVDGEYFSWYGSRLMRAFDYFKALRDRL